MRGEQLGGRYRLTRRMSRGGMGEVWAARDERMQRDVAVKTVAVPREATSAETFLRFRREVRSAASLPGTHTVIAHDCGEEWIDGENVLYLVMELIEGPTLRQKVAEGLPHWSQAVDWAGRIATALDAAHARGIVHRDVKPDNIMFTTGDELKVLDFGIAKFVGDSVTVSGLTATGAAIGTLAYMSPEQLRGERDLDHRSDLYSFGCVLYFMLTGRPPLRADNPYALAMMMDDEPPVPPDRFTPGIPAELSTLVMDLLARSPDGRPRTAAAVAERLRGLTHEEGARAALGRAAEARAQAVEYRAQASDVLARAQEELRAAREQADALREESRAQVERASAEFERQLKARRERVVRDEAARHATAQERLAEIEQRAEQLRREAATLRTDAERHARQIVETAERRAEGIEAGAGGAPPAWDLVRAQLDRLVEESMYIPTGELATRRDGILRQLFSIQRELTQADAAEQTDIPEQKFA
ncbi:protein kinase [Streptomyces sp. NPDC087440]|uniref:protein kinase domain-containing protein n=1 Tax=Streptomyces sp. NPDC087440 TaxID=3365790 RepID=UPI003824D536